MDPETSDSLSPRGFVRHRTTWGERVVIWTRRAIVGPLELLPERRHLMARLEMRRAHKWNMGIAITCAVAPLLSCEAAMLLMSADSQALWRAGWILVAIFAGLWPAVMLLGAAVRSAGAVLAEREEDTALQLVLTLMPKRGIAAAKVLPHLAPFMVGIAAALPLYALAGEWMFRDGQWIPVLAGVWPLRLFLLGEPEGLANFTFRGCSLGALMALTDAGLVWMVTHWAAALAVQTGSMLWVILRLAGRLVLTTLLFYFYFGVACLGYGIVALFCALLPAAIAPREAPTFWFSVPFFLALWWIYPLGDVGRLVLSAFAWFDWLAMDRFERHKRGGLKAWRSRHQDVTARP